jgi:hypothetical protein
MSNVAAIEHAVEQLPPAELAKFRERFAKYDAAQWDRAIEDDVRAGRLNALADEAIADSRSGSCTEIT